MKRKTRTSILVIALTLALTAGFSLSALADEVSIKVVKKWGNRVAIEMENNTPILGVEFTLSDQPDVVTARRIKTTSRTKGFLAQFNDLGEEGVRVVLVSLKGKAISPGSGPILKIAYRGLRGLRAKKANLELTGVNVADINNQPVAAGLTGARY